MSTLRDLFVSENFDKPNKFSFTSMESKTYKGRITWTPKISDLVVDRFGEFKERDFSIGTPDFCKMKLRIFPRGTSENTQNFISFSLVFHRKLPSHAGYRCKLDFLGKEDTVLKSAVEEKEGETNEIHFKDFTHKDTIKDYYVGDKLIIECFLQVFLNSYFSQSDDAEYAVHACEIVKPPRSNTIDHIPKDAIIEVEKKDFAVNRALLMCETPVLGMLFRAAEEVKYKPDWNITASAFEQILQYAYRKEIRLLSQKQACEVYNAASYLRMSNLKDFCATYIGGNLSLENISDSLSVATKCKDEELKKACFDFMVINGINK